MGGIVADRPTMIGDDRPGLGGVVFSGHSAELLPLPLAARRIGVTRQRLDYLVRFGKLPAYYRGHVQCRYLRWADVVEFFRSSRRVWGDCNGIERPRRKSVRIHKSRKTKFIFVDDRPADNDNGKMIR